MTKIRNIFMGLAILLALGIAIEPASANIFGDIVNWLKPEPLSLAATCTQTAFIGQGQTSNTCGVSVRLTSITTDGMHSGNIQSRVTIVYPNGQTEEWVFQDPSARFHMYNGFTFEVISSTSNGINLKITQYKETGVSVRFESNPSGARVALDGNVIGTTPLSYTMDFIHTHQAVFSKSGYQDFTYNIVTPVTIVSANLNPNTQPTPAPSTVNIISSPMGASVSTNGNYIGTTPFSYSMPYGTSKVLQFSLNGYQQMSLTGTYNSVQVHAAMVPIPTVTPQYTHTPEPTYSWTPDPTYNWTPEPTSTSAPPPGKLNLGSTLLVLMVLLVAALYLRRFF